MSTPPRVAAEPCGGAAAVDAGIIAAVLREALPYINHIKGKIIVVKLGGSALAEQKNLLQNLVWLCELGAKPVLVHGGGSDISDWLKRIGKESKFVRGLRVTDDETMEVARMVLVGKVNQGLVAMVNSLGGKAIGLSGLDGRLLECERHALYGDIGHVGNVKKVNLEPVLELIERGYVPVIAPIGYGPGGESLNINADSAAGDIAAELRAEKAIFMTDVEGICDADGGLISEISTDDVPGLISSGVITAGMIPKVEACVRALEGVARAHIVDGRLPHALIRELFTDSGAGTMITKPAA